MLLITTNNLTKPVVSVVELRIQENDNEANLVGSNEIFNENSEGEIISAENIIDISEEFKDIMENISFAEEVDQEEHILFPFDYVD